ncbi:MAG: O-antigen ligase family protein [Armatimonadota bacterium]
MKNWDTAYKQNIFNNKFTAIFISIFLIAVIGLILGIFVTKVPLYYLGAAVVGILLITLAVRQFEAAIVLYILIATITLGGTPSLATGGSSQGKGIYISELLLAFLLAIWTARYLLEALPKDRIRSGFYTPIFLYMAFSILCVINGFIFWDHHVDKSHQFLTVNIIELALRFLSMGAFIMIATSISNRKWLGIATISLMIPGIFNALNTLTGINLPIGALWWPLLTYLPACYLLGIILDKSYNFRSRIISAVPLILILISVIYIGFSWVSGWFGLCIALAVVTLIKNKRLFVAAITVMVILTVVFWPLVNKNLIAPSEAEGDFDRFSLMAGSWKYATTFPLGVGPGNYRSYNTFYYGEKWGTTSYSSAHGTYSQHLAEMGIPGTILLLSILISGFIWMLKSYRNLPSGPSKTYLLAATGQLVGISLAAIIGDYIIPTYHNGGLMNFSTTVYSWLIWGLAVVHVRISGAESNGSLDINSQLEHVQSA